MIETLFLGTSEWRIAIGRSPVHLVLRNNYMCTQVYYSLGWKFVDSWRSCCLFIYQFFFFFFFFFFVYIRHHLSRPNCRSGRQINYYPGPSMTAGGSPEMLNDFIKLTYLRQEWTIPLLRNLGANECNLLRLYIVQLRIGRVEYLVTVYFIHLT